MSLRGLLRRDRVKLREPAYQKDDSGGSTMPAAPMVHENVIGRVNPTGSNEQVAWGTQVFIHTHTLYLDATFGSKIETGWFVETSANELLEVKGKKKFRGIGGLSTYYAVMCQEVEE